MTLPLRNDLDGFPAIGWGGLEPPVGDPGVWHYLAQPECLVQCSGVGKEEGWWSMVLHWLLPPEHLHKKGLLPLPRIQEALESLEGAWHFSCLDLKLGFWLIKMEEASRQHTSFTVGNLGFWNMTACPLGSVMCQQHLNGLCRIAWVS